MFRRLAGDLALWTVYFPYRAWAGGAPLRWVLAGASLLGQVQYLLGPARGRGRVLRSLREVLGGETGEAGARRIARDYLVHKHKTLAEGFALARMSPGEVLARVSAIRGAERLEEARAAGRGAILVLYHFGNFRMMAALGHRGFPLNQFLTRTTAYTERSPRLAARVRDIKIALDQALPAHYIHYRPGASLRPMFEALRRNEFLIIHADGSRGTSFTDAPFLGGRLSFPTGHAKIAARTGAPLIPVFLVRGPGDLHEIVVEEPLRVEADDDASLERATRRCAALLEQWVRRHPEQWWTWARLRATRDAGGRLLLEAAPAETEGEGFFRREGGVLEGARGSAGAEARHPGGSR